MLCGGRKTANKYHGHVWGVLAVYGPHWVCHSSQQCVLSRSTLLSLQLALQGYCPKWALPFVYYPGLGCTGQVLRYSARAQTRFAVRTVPFPGPSSSGDPVLDKHTLPRGMMHLITSLDPAAQFPWCTAGVMFQVCCVSPLGSYSLTAALLLDVNHPGSQEDLVSNWEPAHSLVEDAISGAKIVPGLPVLAIARLPLCLQWGMGQSAAG